MHTWYAIGNKMLAKHAINLLHTLDFSAKTEDGTGHTYPLDIWLMNGVTWSYVQPISTLTLYSLTCIWAIYMSR